MPNMFGAMASGIKKGLQAPGKALMKAPGMKTLAKPMNTAMRATPGLGKLPGAMGMGAPTQGLGPSPQMTPPPPQMREQLPAMQPPQQDMQLDQSMMQNPDMSQVQQPDMMQNQVMPQMNPQMQPEPQMMKMFGQSFPRPQVQPRQSAMSRKIQTARGIGPSMG